MMNKIYRTIERLNIGRRKQHSDTDENNDGSCKYLLPRSFYFIIIQSLREYFINHLLFTKLKWRVRCVFIYRIVCVACRSFLLSTTSVYNVHSSCSTVVQHFVCKYLLLLQFDIEFECEQRIPHKQPFIHQQTIEIG